MRVVHSIRPWLFTVAVVAILLVAATAPAQIDGRAMPSRVIYPVQSLPITFSHQRHLALKLDCAYCHEDAPDSTRSADNLIPREDSCTTCHEIERDKPMKAVAAGQPPANCAACHPGWSGPASGTEKPPVVVPAPSIKFNHKVHVDRKVRCQTCHGDLAAEKVDLATRAQLPRMPTCLTCHDGKQAPSACTTCHVSTRDALVETDLPEGKLIPSGVLRGDAHDLQFETNHASVAANDEAYCANCHQRKFCTECHNGIRKPMDFHGNDYISIHPVDARRNSPDCSACHRLQTFCTGCHARSGVTDDNRTSEFTPPSKASPSAPALNRFHPDGWWTTNNPDQRSASHHSFQAERNIQQCASCHRESFCQGCHGQQIDPHPVGWAHSSKCKAMISRAGRTCLKCHLKLEDVQCF
jgi:hypothetical protein